MACTLKGIEYIFPDNKISNSDLSSMYPNYNFSKIEKKVGIHNRYWVEDNETGLDLAVKAANKLFKKFDRESVDYVLYCTQSPEYILPTSACILQDKLGLRKNIGAFDFNLGCSGYVYGLSMAKALIDSNQANNVLLVTAETYSKYLHVKDHSNRALFGDAASASLVSRSDKDTFGKFIFGTDGSGYDKLIISNGGSRNHFNQNCEEKEYGSGNIYTDNNLYMNGPDIFNFTNDVIPSVAKEVLLENELKDEMIDQYILHQANAFMLNVLRLRMNVSKDRFYINMKDGGNTVSNTIPIALKNYTNSRTNAGPEKICLFGFGVGLSWCGGIVEINKEL